jgi:hypothetical protein
MLPPDDGHLIDQNMQWQQCTKGVCGTVVSKTNRMQRYIKKHDKTPYVLMAPL